jgi:hypothetical protein
MNSIVSVNYSASSKENSLNPKKMLLTAEEADRVTYFNVLQEGFLRAVNATSLIEKYFNVGGYVIRLRFAGSGLISHITPALAHLVVDPTESPALTICLWDSVSTQTRLPLLAESLVELIQNHWTDHLGPRKEIKQYDGERIRAVFHIGPNILSLLDTQENIALYWVDNTQQIPYWEHGSPLQTILNWWTGYHQRQYVHAGAVGTPEGGVLLAGKGGSGKSTTALACLNSDLVYASDDYCLVSAEPAPYAYSLYNTAKLKGKADLDRLPHLAPLVTNADRLDEEKAMIFLHLHYPNKIIDGFPIRAILVPHVAGKSDTCLRKISPILALRALAPSTIFQLPGSGENALKNMSKIVKQVPCYELVLGTDMAQIPEIILELLSQLNYRQNKIN